MKKFLLLIFVLTPFVFFAQCWQQAAAGYTHTLGLKSDGTLWAWGQNNKGQLGIGNNTNQNTPVQVGTGTSWIWIGAGNEFSIARKADGTLWTWGAGALGQLGTGSNQNSLSPVQVGTDTDWATTSVEGYHVLAIKTNGTLWAWGANGNSQLGDNSIVNKFIPVQIGSDTDWLMASAGVFHSGAIKTDNSLWTWGNNAFGQLANWNSGIDGYNFPIMISLDTDWRQIALSAMDTYVVKSDGSLWGAGYHMAEGLLQVDPPVNVAVVEPSYNDNYFVLSDGTLWAAGDNNYGQLANGNTSANYEYNKVNEDTNWVSVSSTLNTAAAIKSDGTLWMWGNNNYNQLGNTTTGEFSTVPLQVVCPVAGYEIATVERISIYPNPANDSFYISNPSGVALSRVVITDLSGKKVLEQFVSPGLSVAVEHLLQGVYVVKIFSDEGAQNIRFVKK